MTDDLSKFGRDVVEVQALGLVGGGVNETDLQDLLGSTWAERWILDSGDEHELHVTSVESKHVTDPEVLG